MKRSPVHLLLPSAIELGYVGLVTFMLILVGNAKLVLEKLGIIGSANLIGRQVTTTATSGLTTLSNFQFTASAANMLVWGVTGLVIYSALQSIVKTLRRVQYQRDLEQRYIHPQGFNRRVYWQQITADAILGFVLLVLLVAGGILYVVVVVPASFAYLQRFIVRPELGTIIDPFLSLVIAFLGTAALYMIVKLVIRQHRANTIGEDE